MQTVHCYKDCQRGRRVKNKMTPEQRLKSLAMVIENHISFRVGARVLLSGASGSGKTHFISQVIEHREELFEFMPQKIIFCTHEGTRQTHLKPELLEARNNRGDP
jgi:MoxR-like ATPase